MWPLHFDSQPGTLYRLCEDDIRDWEGERHEQERTKEKMREIQKGVANSFYRWPAIVEAAIEAAKKQH